MHEFESTSNEEFAETFAETFAIAVIGMAGRFPGAENVAQFWQNLRHGVESITFFTGDELIQLGVDPGLVSHPDFVKACPMLKGIDLFDANFFGYSAQEASVLDPQQRLFLETAWTALEDAAYDPETFSGLIGVYAGSGISSYLLFNILNHPELTDPAAGLGVLMNNTQDFLATRTAYKLNLKGPALTIQTACSTSLVAVHLACQSLLDYQCDMALAGGTAVTLPQRMGYLYQPEGIFSPDGHCRSFDAQAQGTIFGSGVGVVVLKRLEEAVRDGDHIYAVIKGTAVNNDGAAKVGFTAPSITGQADVIGAALAAADVDAKTIGYVEAHGTATPIGDPIEVAALARVFQAAGVPRQACALGSVKTNVGHLDAAAGVAGLIKAVQVIQNGEIPPHLHFKQPNPRLDLANSPFFVNQSLHSWPSTTRPRRAGVSSFGLGGTNAHLILEEAPPAAAPGDSRPWQLLLLSARSPAALEEMRANLVDYLRRRPDSPLADVVYTYQIGRQAMAHRLAVVVSDITDAMHALEKTDTGRIASAFLPSSTAQTPVVFMFPGYGAQYEDMGAELYRMEPTFRRYINECAVLLEPHLEIDLRQILGYKGVGDVSNLLFHPATGMPALFAVEYALAQLWMAWGVRTEAMIGHSLGEYVAACLAGVLSLKDALALVVLRGKLFARTEKGAMLAVALSEDELRPFLHPGLSIAAINGPSLCTVAGSITAIEPMAQELSNKRVAHRQLPIDLAAHSPLIEPILDEFGQFARNIPLQEPQIPYVSNVSGDWMTAAEARRPDYWVQHLRQPVRFAAGLGRILEDHGRILLEVGPGQTLSALVKRQPDSASSRHVVSSLAHPQTGQSDSRHLLTSIGQLWLKGVPVDWNGFYKHEQRRRLSLPAYPFERQRYWVDPPGKTAAVLETKEEKRSRISDWFYLPSWQRQPLIRPQTGNETPSMAEQWLLFIDSCGVGMELARQLREQGGTAVTVTPGAHFYQPDDQTFTINPADKTQYKQLFSALKQPPQKILHFWNVTPPESGTVTEAETTAFNALVWLAQAISERNDIDSCELLLLTSNLYSVTGDEALQPEKALILGPFTVIPLEYPQITCRLIDLVITADTPPLPHLLESLIREARFGQENVVAYRGLYRWQQTFQPVRLADAPGKQVVHHGVYLITGGLGGIGLELAHYLAETYQARLILTGRSALPPRHEWANWLAAHPHDDRTSRRLRQLQALEEAGAEVMAIAADVTDAAQMESVVRDVQTRWGRIDGVIHAAAVPGGGLMASHVADQAAQTLAPKVQGVQVLEALFQEIPPDLFILCSSINPFAGGVGSAAYTAANAFLDAYAQARFMKTDTAVTSINWGRWQDVGMMASTDETPAELQQIQQQQRQTAMSPAEGQAAFHDIITHLEFPQIIVSPQDFPTLLAHSRTQTTTHYLETIAGDNVATHLHPRPPLPNDYTPPRTPIEQQLAEIWQTLLGIEKVGIHDHFFELGGHSLLGTRLAARIRQDFKIELPLHTLFEAATIAGLAGRLSQAQTTSAAERPLTAYQDATIDQLLAEIKPPSSAEHVE